MWTAAPGQMGQMNDAVAALAREQARHALQEDIGGGDLTAPLLGSARLSARLICREAAVLCGVPWFETCFRLLDESAQFEWHFAEGALLPSLPPQGAQVCRVSARAPALLAAERSAINFLQTLSATATAANRWQRAAGDKVKIVDTRKTLPLLRQAQKYAVRVGGATNHRQGLHDEILIKENHIRAAGGIAAAMAQAQALAAAAQCPPPQIEVRSLDELQQALAAGATRILLDNFTLADIKAAVACAPPPVELEASGAITLDTVAAVAACGVARISAGALTKHIRAVDFSLLVDEADE